MDDELTRFILGIGTLMVVELVLGGTLIYVARRRKHFEPYWPWWRAVWAYAVFSILVGLVSMVPGIVPRFIAMFISFLGLKMLADLSFWRAFFAMLCVNLIVLLVAAPLSAALEINLFQIWDLEPSR